MTHGSSSQPPPLTPPPIPPSPLPLPLPTPPPRHPPAPSPIHFAPPVPTPCAGPCQTKGPICMVLGHNALISLEALGGLQGCKGTGQSSASGQCGLQNGGGGGCFGWGGGWAVGRFPFFLGSLSRRKRFCISGFQRSRSVPTEHATAVSVSNPFFFFSRNGGRKKKKFLYLDFFALYFLRCTSLKTKKKILLFRLCFKVRATFLITLSERSNMSFFPPREARDL